jgi:glycosyltransferase involved in cell wall biosynthesis
VTSSSLKIRNGAHGASLQIVLRVVFTIAGLHPESGGPSRSVPALASALAQVGGDVELVTCESLMGQSAPLLPPRELVTSHLLAHSCSSTRWWPRTNAFATVLRERCRDARGCVIHDHGLWLPNNHAVASAARSMRVPRIVSPRGMLTSWALQHRGWKKKIAWELYQRSDLQSAQVLHATSLDEATVFRAAGLTQAVAMIPNGVDLPAALNSSLRLDRGLPPLGEWRKEFAQSKAHRAERAGASESLGQGEVSNQSPSSHLPSPTSLLPAPGSVRTALFVGRIHPIKGLLNLVNAWAQVQPRGWRMVIAGTGAGGHMRELKAEIRKLKLDTSFEFVGSVEGQAKWDLYRRAELFVLPSHSENFGIVVAEALACGVPVITTRGTPWQDLVVHSCGWWINNGTQPLAEALRDAMSRTDEEQHEMGRRGRELVGKNYSWPGIAAQMYAVYRWMLGHGAKPNCVVD